MTAPAAARPIPDDHIAALVRSSNPSEGIPGHWTKEQLAQKLRRSERTLDRMYSTGLGPPRISVGAGSGVRSTLTLYKISEVERWLDSLAVGPVRRSRTRRPAR